MLHFFRDLASKDRARRAKNYRFAKARGPGGNGQCGGTWRSSPPARVGARMLLASLIHHHDGEHKHSEQRRTAAKEEIESICC